MLVWRAVGDGTLERRPAMVCHVRYEREERVSDDAHRSDGCSGRVFVDARNSEGAFEVPSGSKVLVGAGPSVMVRAVKRCCVVRGHVHHWELEVG